MCFACRRLKRTPDQVPALLCEMEGYWCHWHGGPKGYSGVALQVRKEFCPERPYFQHPEFDFENRIVTAEIGGMTIASIYMPNGGKDFPAKMRFLAALEVYAISFVEAKRPLILCGDIHIARAEIDVHPKERNPGVTGQLPEERAWFEQLLAHGLVDVGRTLDPNNDGLFTWWAPWRNMRARNIGWRLDYILATESLAHAARSCTVHPGFQLVLLTAAVTIATKKTSRRFPENRGRNSGA